MKQMSDGIWIPDSDSLHNVYYWTMTEIGIPDRLMDIREKNNLPIGNVIHAGGNIGIYTLKYAERADNVYVFEPASENFEALSMNCAKKDNVFLYRAILGDSNNTIDIVNDTTVVGHNCGAWKVKGSGNIPQIKIDDLNLKNIGIIQLDAEGYELKILQGAIETIKKYKPLICLEMYKHGATYNSTDDEIIFFLHNMGYRYQSPCCNDMVYAHMDMNIKI